MSQNRYIAGLDVGTTKICAIIAEIVDDGQSSVLGVGISPCEGLKKGIVVDMVATSSAIKDAIEKAERMAGVQIQSLVVGVTGEHISCVNNRSVIAINHPEREIRENDLDRLMDTARIIVLPPEREIIHAIPRWYAIDGQSGIHSPVGMHGSRLEMETHIVTGLSSFINNVVKCVHLAGFSVDGTVLEPIADAESVLVNDERELGVALIDIGGGTSDLAIYIDGQIYYSGVIPVGGNHFSRDIAVGLCCSLEEAERVKKEHGSAIADGNDMEPFEVTVLSNEKPRFLPKKVLVEIIEPRLSELVQLALDEIERAGCQGRLPTGLVFTGGGSQIRGLAEIAGKLASMPVRIGKPIGFSGMTDVVQKPECATAAGLVLYWSRHSTKEAVHVEEGPIWTALISKIKELLSRFSVDL